MLHHKKIFLLITHPHMEQRTKIIMGVIAILIVGTVALATQPNLFKGSFLDGDGDFDGPYLYNTAIVSAVTSAVPSVVTSSVSSGVSSNVSSGTSKVVSKVTSNVSSSVPSVVTSPVASAVPLLPGDTRGIDPNDLEELTGDILRKVEKVEYQRNPARFSLSKEEMIEIIKLYDRRAPPSPIPAPRGR